MISRLFSAFILLIFSFGIFSLNAATLNETALKILLNSPGYKAENYSLEAVSRNLATNSNLPDPTLGGEYLVAPSEEDNRWAAELSWDVEWPGVYSARNKEAKMKMTSAERSIYVERAQRLAEIKDLLLDYIRCQQKLTLLEELSHNNDTIYRLAEEAARGGELTVLDLNKIKLEYANIRVARATILDEQAEVIESLSKIYGNDCGELLNEMNKTFPEIIMPTADEMAIIKENAPAVMAAKAEAETAHLARKVAQMEALPNLSVGYKHAFEDGMHFNGAILGVSIPLFSSRGKQKAAKADILEAEYKAEATSREIETEAMAAFRRLEMINRQIEEVAPIIENVDYNNTLLKAYKGGVITLIEYITDRNYFTNAALELVSLRHNAAKALAFLQRYTSPL